MARFTVTSKINDISLNHSQMIIKEPKYFKKHKNLKKYLLYSCVLNSILIISLIYLTTIR